MTRRMISLLRHEGFLDVRAIAVLRRATSGSRITFDALSDAPRARGKLSGVSAIQACIYLLTPLSHFVFALAHVTHAMALREAIL